MWVFGLSSTPKDKNFTLKLEKFIIYDIDPQNRSLNLKIDFENIDKFGFRSLQSPLEALTMVYPHLDFETALNNKEGLEETISQMIGKRGLRNVMNFKDTVIKKNPIKHKYSYKKKNPRQIWKNFPKR